MYSHINGKLPSAFTDYFSKNDTIHKYNTRSSTKSHVSYRRKNHGKFSVKFRRAEIWNSLPTTLKDIKSIYNFKKEVKLFVQKQYDSA